MINQRSLFAFSLMLVAFLAACGGGGGNDTNGDAVVLQDIPYVVDIKDVASPEATENTHPPVLGKIGDRVIAVGEKLTIVLTATDAANDPLTFSVYGDIPDGASFDKVNNVFTWVPLQAGTIVYLTFVVSDGTSLDRETVELKVVAEKVGHPPAFQPLSDQKATVGTALRLQLEALDPDGDPLTFGILGSRPDGAAINPSTGEFTWTPAAAHDNSVVKVTFSVSDTVFDDTMEVQFLVGSVGSPPVIDAIGAQTATVGTELRFTLSASDPEGDAVSFAVTGGMPQNAVFDSGSALFVWTPLDADAGRAYAIVFSASDGLFTSYATVDVTVAKGGGTVTCSDDQFEPNNAPDQAPTLAPGTYNLSICDSAGSPVDSDWFLVPMNLGETVTVVLSFVHDQGDIDCDLSYDGNESGVVAFSNTTSGQERFEFTADETRTYVLAVYGVADATYSNPYSMNLSITTTPPVCQDDSLEDNDTVDAAKAILGTEPALADLVLCPADADFFAVTLRAGDSLLASATPSSGAVGLELLGPDRATVIDTAGPATASSLVVVEEAVAGTYYLRVLGTGTATYGIEILVESAGPACTPMSCPRGQYCNTTSGACVSETCQSTANCTSGASCIDNHCILPCDGDEDCRTSYTCKNFPLGRFCGEYENKLSGATCSTFLKCAGDRICLFQEYGGYCATYGCTDSTDCDQDAACINDNGMNYCAALCTTTCRNELFDCRSGLSTDGLELDLCLP